MTIIRERLTRVVGHFAQLEIALFNTFTFSADFLEQNVLPALFGCEPEQTRSVREASVHKGLMATRVAAFYDASMAKVSKRRYRYTATPVFLPSRKLFHPKNIILIGRDHSGERWIYVAALSANLSISGWGHNREAFADTWIHAKSEQPARALRDFLQWLKKTTGKRSDVLAAALAAWDELREKRRLADPEGGTFEAKAGVRLYFSPLSTSFWSFVEEEYGALNSVVAGSPYWGDSSQAAEKLSEVSLKLIAARCAPRFQSVNLGQDTLAQLFPDGPSTEQVRAWRGDKGRFHHLKAYQMRTAGGDVTGLGSCNFTDAGQFWTETSGNAESMLLDWASIELPPADPLKTADIPLESAGDDPPAPLPAYVTLQYDWRDGVYSWRVDGSANALPVTLRIPDGGKPVVLDAIGGEGRRAGPLLGRTYTFTFERDGVYEGLVEELNVSESTMAYGRALPIRDILESWRTRSAAEPPAPDDEEDDTAAGSDAPVPGSPAGEDELNEESLDWFLFYRGIRDMRSRFEQAAEDERSLLDLALVRSDSVLALCEGVLSSAMPVAAQWLVVRECRSLLKGLGKLSPLMKRKMKALDEGMAKLRLLVEADLERILRARRLDAQPGQMLDWYEKQILKAASQ